MLGDVSVVSHMRSHFAGLKNGAAACDNDSIGVGELGANAVGERNSFVGVSARVPGADHFFAVSAERPDESDFSLLGERQDVVGVLQKHTGHGGGLARESNGIGLEIGGFVKRFVSVGMIKKALGEFNVKDAANGFVNDRQRNGFVVDLLRKCFGTSGGDHLHVHPSGESIARGVHVGGSDAVINEFGDGIVIADDEAAEAPVLAKDIDESVTVRAGGHAGEVVEGAHDRQRSRVYAGLELREIKIPKREARDFGGVVISTTFSSAVADVMFEAGDNAVGVGAVGSLEATHVGGGIKRGRW